MTTYGNKVMATLHDPFSNKNYQPKYPDGKTSFSTGFRGRDNAIVSSREIVVLLFPGAVNQGCVCARGADGSMQVVATCQPRGGIDYTHSGQAGTAKITPGSDWASWRPVSTGIRITPFSSTDEQEGWWEAIRTPMVKLAGNFGVVESDNHQDIQNRFYEGSLCPTNEFLAKLNGGDSDQWVLGESYSTGKIRDLHKKMFVLNKSRTDNDFLDLFTIKMVDNNSTQTIATDATDRTIEIRVPFVGTGDTTRPEHSFQAAFRSVASPAFDVVIIKIHSTEEQDYLVELAANQEFHPHHGRSPVGGTLSYSAIDELRRFEEVRVNHYRRPDQDYSTTRRAKFENDQFAV